jgi:amino acid transporter
MATLNAATARIADGFSDDGLDSGVRAGLVFGLVVITAGSNLIGVRLYGRLERVIAIFKLLLILLLIIICIGILLGLGGPRNAGEEASLLNSRSANFTTFGMTPGFRPDGYRYLDEWDVDTKGGALANEYGIPGSHGGRLFALLTAVTLAMFSCMGGDQVSTSTHSFVSRLC